MLKQAYISNNTTDFSFYKDVYLSSIDRSGLNYLNGEHTSIGNGRKSLQTIRECNIYTALYGGMHYYKLSDAFSRIQFDDIQFDSIEINDYGCGQAFASIVLIETLLNKNYNIKNIKVRLFDTSDVAINNGVLYLNKLKEKYNFINNISIEKYNVDMNSIEKLDRINSNVNSFKFHLLSNILDIYNVSSVPVSNFINENFTNKNHFVCVSPSYCNVLSRMRVFENKFKSAKSISEITSPLRKQIYRFSGGKRLTYQAITRIEKQFIAQI